MAVLLSEESSSVLLKPGIRRSIYRNSLLGEMTWETLWASANENYFRISVAWTNIDSLSIWQKTP